MNMTHDEMIEVIQAHKEGKEIEYKSNVTGEWCASGKPAWDFQCFEYRIKATPPEPKTIWVNECGVGYADEVHESEDRAVVAGKGASYVNRLAVKYQEVIE